MGKRAQRCLSLAASGMYFGPRTIVHTGQPAACLLSELLSDSSVCTSMHALRASGMHALNLAFCGTTSCFNQGWHPCDLVPSLYTVEHLAALGQDRQAPISRKVGLRSALRPRPLG